MNLKDKSVVIVGATGGIGSQVSKVFFKEDAKLILVARSEEKLKKLADQFGKNLVKYYVCDFSDPKQAVGVASTISQENNNIDILINVAGVGVYKNIEDVNLKEWENSFAVNVSAPYFVTKELLPSLKNSENAVVVNFGSGMGKNPMGGRSVYCATKYALRGMTLSLSEEFKGTNIKIVLMTLGSILTDFGPLSLEEKEKLSLEGKGYLTPDWVAKKLIDIISSNNLEDEIEIYPSHYKD